MNLNVKAILAVTAWMKLSLNAESLGNKQITFLLNNVKIEHYNECWHSNSFVLWFCVPVFSGEGIFLFRAVTLFGERHISLYIFAINDWLWSWQEKALNHTSNVR